MSYTVVMDEQERELRFENRLNAVARHCRIGRVRPKTAPHHLWSGIVAAPARPKRDTFFIEPWLPSIYAPNTAAA